MEKLSDKDLLESYKLAQNLELESAFIRLLEEEIKRRDL